MFALIGLIYNVGLWGTFLFLVYLDWNRCAGMGGCLIGLGFDFLRGLLWPLFWLGLF